MLPTPTHAVKPLECFVLGENARTIEVDDALRELNQSLRNGQLQPVGGIEQGDKIRLLYGYRRYHAAKLGGVDKLAVLIYPSTMTETEAKVAQATENLQREDLSDPQVYTLCKQLLGLNPAWKRQDLASHLGKSPAWVTQILCVDDLVPEAREAFMAGKLGFTLAYAITRAPDQLAALHAKLNGASRADIDRSRRKPNPEAVRTAKIRCPLPSGYTVVVSGQDASLEEGIDALNEALKAMKGMLGKGYSAKTFEKAMRDMAGKGE